MLFRSELGGAVAALRTLVEGGSDSMRQSLSRMETQLRQQQAAGKQEVGDVQQGMLKLAAKLDTLGTRDDAPLQPLQQKLGQVEVAIAAIAQRLEDSEVRKSLLRLEDAEKARMRTMEALARTDTVHQDVEKLENQIDRGLGKLGNVLEQVRNGNLGAIETSMRDMQRELAGLATAVAQIQQSVRTGGGRAAATSAAQSQPVPASTAPAQASTPPATGTSTDTTAQTPKTTAAPNAAVETQGMTDAQAGAAQNQTGTRASSGKNVLGAIAKLKKLKN